MVRPGYPPRGELLDRSYFPISRKRPCRARHLRLAWSFSSAREFRTMSTPERERDSESESESKRERENKVLSNVLVP